VSDQFTPIIQGKSSCTSAGIGGLYIEGSPQSDDSAKPAIVLRAKDPDDNSATDASPVLQIKNWTTDLVTVDKSGNIGVGTTSPSISDGVGIHISGKILRIATSKSPASGGTGNAGEICWDSSYLYVCTATNTWKRVALTGGY